jgi:hypothetical protein
MKQLKKYEEIISLPVGSVLFVLFPKNWEEASWNSGAFLINKKMSFCLSLHRPILGKHNTCCKLYHSAIKNMSESSEIRFFAQRIEDDRRTENNRRYRQR